MQPRIYVYLITFVDQPYWYWGWHKERKYDEYYMGSPKTNKRYWDMYEPIKEIVEVFDYTEMGEFLAQTLEGWLIEPDLNNPLCLNESCGRVISIKALSDSAKKLWQDPDYQEKVSKAMSKVMSEKWKDPVYRNNLRIKLSDSKKENWKDPVYCSKISKIRQEMWDDESHKEKMSHIMREVCSDPDYRKSLSERSRKMWEDPDYRRKMKEIQGSSDYKRKVSEKVKNSHQTAKYRINAKYRAKGKKWVFCPDLEINMLINLDDPVPEGFLPGILNDDYEELERAEIQELFLKVEQSGINLQEYGWVKKVSLLWGVSHTQVRRVFNLQWKGPEPYRR